MTRFAPHARVLVSPRHLAGAGIDRLADAIGPLIHLFGWPNEHDRATGRITVNTLDSTLFVTFNSRHTQGQWWSVAHHDPFWEARFTRQTPIEAIAAVTQALPQLAGDFRHADRIPLTTSTLAEIAELNHWRHEGSGTFTSPDGHCRLQNAPAKETPWRFRHHVYDGFGTHWDASFTQDTPGTAGRPVLHPPLDDRPGRARLPRYPPPRAGLGRRSHHARPRNRREPTRAPRRRQLDRAVPRR
ncbi:DUF317 domain-containing protein [Streptomyces sp. NPDC048281]|uniref:DUF317 domain-containing protein n=1 Tax=Streptomyces sp. NPDC048281 TaxID=3154715 RepID=UPI00343FD22D